MTSFIRKLAVTAILLCTCLSANALTAVTQSVRGNTQLKEKCIEQSGNWVESGLITTISWLNARNQYSGMFITVGYSDASRNIIHISHSETGEISFKEEMQKVAMVAYLNRTPVTLCVSAKEGWHNTMPLLGIELN